MIQSIIMKKCIELDHNYAKAYYNLGVTKYYLNSYKEALNYVEYAYKLFNNAKNKEACAKCLESIEYIKEEHGLWDLKFYFGFKRTVDKPFGVILLCINCKIYKIFQQNIKI